MYVCDQFEPGLTGTATVLEDMPLVAFAAGLGMELDDASVKLPDGRLFSYGMTVTLEGGVKRIQGDTCDGLPSETYVVIWEPGAADDEGQTYGWFTEPPFDFDQFRFTRSGQRVTIAHIPQEQTELPPPPPG